MTKRVKYTFGNDEFSLEAAYHDCKLVFDGITDDDSFQEADTGLILYYANEIIYALHKALEGVEPKQPENGSEQFGNTEQLDDRTTDDCISRQAAIEAQERIMSDHPLDGYEDERLLINALKDLPSAQPEIIRCKDCKYNATSKKCLNPNSFFLVPADDDFCSYAERRTDE